MEPDREPVLEARDLVKEYPLTRGALTRRRTAVIRAVDGVSVTLLAGQTLAVVGESGCGKSTLSRLLVGLEPPTTGWIRVMGRDLSALSSRDMRSVRRDIQIILQDPYSSLNPRMTVGGIVREAFAIHPEALPAGRSSSQAVADLLDRVGLDPRLMHRYPHQLSGGQRQRISIARALALRPRIIVADEPVSALDVSLQAQVINLMMDLRAELDLSYVFISHDLALVRQIADAVAVMYLGRIVEQGSAEGVFGSPRHPYTRALLSAVPVADPTIERTRESITLVGDVPDPTDPPSGCHFRTRCWKAQDACSTEVPALTTIAPDHSVACHFPESPG